jgi:polysaccharide pyruvyl transferase WcaK-like protein
MPGGTPIMDVLGDWPLNEVAGVIASARQKPVVFIGTGTERLKHDRSREIVARDLAPHVVRWTVRSSRDKERLVEYGVPAQRVTEAADLAWTLEPVTPDFGRDRLRELGVDLSHGVVGVNVNREPHMMLSAPSLLEELAGGLDRIISDSGASVIFLCNEVRDGESFDRATSETVLAAMKQRNRAHLVPNHYYTPQEMQSFIGCCATTISTRYHFCLLSAVQRVPFVALKRSDKVDDLCFDLQWPFGKRLEDVTASSLLDQFHGVASQRPELEGLLAERTGVLRERSLTNAVALEALRA